MLSDAIHELIHIYSWYVMRFKKLDIFARAHVFICAWFFLLRKWPVMYIREWRHKWQFSRYLTRKPNPKRKCKFLSKFYVRVRQFRENVTLDLFARVEVSLVFSEASYTIKTKINHFINKYMAICWITNTITLYNMPAHFIVLYLHTHNRFRKGDILTSVSFHAVSQIYGC